MNSTDGRRLLGGEEGVDVVDEYSARIHVDNTKVAERGLLPSSSRTAPNNQC